MALLPQPKLKTSEHIFSCVSYLSPIHYLTMTSFVVVGRPWWGGGHRLQQHPNMLLKASTLRFCPTEPDRLLEDATKVNRERQRAMSKCSCFPVDASDHVLHLRKPLEKCANIGSPEVRTLQRRPGLHLYRYWRDDT